MKETLAALTDMLKAANTFIEADKCFADHLEHMGTNALTTGSQHPTIGKNICFMYIFTISAVQCLLLGSYK